MSTEPESLNVLRQMAGLGIGSLQIARALNSQGLKTPERKKIWSKNTVAHWRTKLGCPAATQKSIAIAAISENAEGQKFQKVFEWLIFMLDDNEKIAAVLNRKGFRTATEGKPWTKQHVCSYKSHLREAEAVAADDESLFQNDGQGTEFEDFYPYILPVCTNSDFYCRDQPGPLRYPRKRIS